MTIRLLDFIQIHILDFTTIHLLDSSLDFISICISLKIAFSSLHQVVYQILSTPGEEVNFLCEELDFTDSWRGMKSAQMSYFYFLVKLLDLVDTICFVLRKRTRQISFLHVYHHTAILIGAYIGVSWAPGTYSRHYRPKGIPGQTFRLKINDLLTFGLCDFSIWNYNAFTAF